MQQFGPYFLTALLSAVVVLAMGICLFAVAMPSDPKLSGYRLSRRLLGVAYVFLAGIHLAGIFIDSGIHLSTIVAPFQALMFTFALIVLINNRFVTRRRLLVQLAILSALTTLVMVNDYALPAPLVWLSLLLKAIYPALFVYYVWIFFREYRNYKRRANNFYSDNEHKRLRWVVEVFVTAAVIGVFGGVLEENNIYFLIFIACYTLLYTYLAIRYINYVGQFHRMAPVVEIARNEERHKEVRGEAALAQWVEQKEFRLSGTTLDSLADQLCVSSSWLSRHINSTHGQNFRSWIASLRIGEAIRLLETNPEMRIDEIQELSGIPTSSFFRQFHSATGVSPAEYRSRLNGDRETKG
ncbi:MAG: helix-turn-helix domain-containing protein [Alistipes sp.]|jgi:AraC-like DNA-binding protein|nr:helix-turn-helix domain-containing protein [Alistipes sp.]